MRAGKKTLERTPVPYPLSSIGGSAIASQIREPINCTYSPITKNFKWGTLRSHKKNAGKDARHIDFVF